MVAYVVFKNIFFRLNVRADFNNQKNLPTNYNNFITQYPYYIPPENLTSFFHKS
jgi:hypothetical protein